MNSATKPGDYPLYSLRGRTFLRLNENAVETFNLVVCDDCEVSLRANSLIVSEPSDSRLTNEGLKISLEDKRENAIPTHIHGGYLCPTCYAKWLLPLETTHE